MSEGAPKTQHPGWIVDLHEVQVEGGASSAMSVVYVFTVEHLAHVADLCVL